MSDKRLLTETADYNEDGAWDRISNGWPSIKERAQDAYVFANCVETIPYGSYVLVGKALRVHADFIGQLRADFAAAGSPSAKESIERREKFGNPTKFGNKDRAPKWVTP